MEKWISVDRPPGGGYSGPYWLTVMDDYATWVILARHMLYVGWLCHNSADPIEGRVTHYMVANIPKPYGGEE